MVADAQLTIYNLSKELMNMILQEKLQMLRKKNGYSQEQLADKLGIARQTIGKWENGQALPELGGLIALSNLYGVTIDRLVKDDDTCNKALCQKGDVDIDKVIDFLLEAKRHTYAAKHHQVQSSREGSVDYQYEKEGYLYYDTYLESEKFAGEEAAWQNGEPIWSMNYVGRVLGEQFSGDFLKEALKRGTKEMPYRGPAIYQNGDYTYHCKVEGEFVWFQGYEEIFYQKEKIYECYFHGGRMS